ncbi:hypothetical protein M433DRAFT_151000 [Acidomyces richmondensis BFW]|nr:MAG: hypothetical protein FE78DRAFT_93928 [Acidomyces sp. 'richmondensis']KYG48559.1 hypothetical protein M433DRAFT_151000 [Acidomyces richmondensis BFW]
MPKERSINPVQAQRKAEKQKEINKSRKLQQAQRNEKLARRNPERLQRQIDEYKELEERGVLCSKDRETLAQLEKDLRSIKRAREALGDVAPKFGREEKRDGRQEQKERRQKHQHQQSLGKRRRDEEVAHSADTDPKVHMIPMPRDTPPPFPYEHFAASRMQTHEKRELHALPAKPVVPAQTVYSAAPQLRDLKKEALKFMPSVVSQKRSRIKGEGRLLEPEELDGLERSGYTAGHNASITMGQKVDQEQEATAGKVETGDIDLEEEAKKFEEEIKDTYILQMQSARDNKADPRSVQLEEVKDEGD